MAPGQRVRPSALSLLRTIHEKACVRIDIAAHLHYDRGFAILSARGRRRAATATLTATDSPTSRKHTNIARTRRKRTLPARVHRTVIGPGGASSPTACRAVIRVMPPYNLAALNDDYQDVRVVAETRDYAELEVVTYPLNTCAARSRGTRTGVSIMRA